MRNKIIIVLGVFIFSNENVLAQNRISIHVPTAEQEAAYVWRTIQDIKFFNEHNYQLNLPSGDLIASLKRKSLEGKLTEKDYPTLEKHMQDNVYREDDYQKGAQKIRENISSVNYMLDKIGKCKREWKFKAFETYQITLTLYGPGGSYDPDNGSILIFTTVDGGFKNYLNPANILMHEIVHIGMEESIINKYNVPHPLKERLVDRFVLLNFEEHLPAYKMQNMGDARIDSYLKKKKDLKDLKGIVEKFMLEN